MATGVRSTPRWSLTGPHYTHYITSFPVTFDENLDFVQTRHFIEVTTDYTVIDLCKNRVEWYPEFEWPNFYGRCDAELNIGSSFNNAEHFDNFSTNLCISKIDFTDFTGENLRSMNNFCAKARRDVEITWRYFNPSKLQYFKNAFRSSAISNADLSTIPIGADITGAFKGSKLMFAGTNSMQTIHGYFDNKFLESNIYMSDSLLIFTNELPVKQFQQLCQYPVCIKPHGYAFKLSDNLTEDEKEFLQKGGFYEFNQH